LVSLARIFLLVNFTFQDFICLNKQLKAKKVRPGVGRNLYRSYLSCLKGYRLEISAFIHHFGWIDAPNTQNFENLKSLETTQESKQLKIGFEIFVKMLGGSIFLKSLMDFF
jgi:hypothetical protein